MLDRVLEQPALRAEAGVREDGVDPAVLVERLFLRDPVAVAQEKRALTGTVILLSPVSSAWVCCFFGLPVAQLFGYAALSFICVALWGWRYRRIIGYAG